MTSPQDIVEGDAALMRANFVTKLAEAAMTVLEAPQGMEGS